MRRLVKEQLLKFDGTPLFPERLAYTVNYELSDGEAACTEVTDYVREEFNRAEALENEGRKGTVGFALDHPAAPAGIVARSDLPIAAPPPRTSGETAARRTDCSNAGQIAGPIATAGLPVMTPDDLDDLDDAPDAEVEDAEEQVVDQASAARTIAELQVEIEMLKRPGRAGLPGPAQRNRQEVG